MTYQEQFAEKNLVYNAALEEYSKALTLFGKSDVRKKSWAAFKEATDTFDAARAEYKRYSDWLALKGFNKASDWDDESEWGTGLFNALFGEIIKDAKAKKNNTKS